MRPAVLRLLLGIYLASAPVAAAQDSSLGAPSQKSAQDAAAKKDAQAEAELQKAFADSGNDSVALIRNLTGYLDRFPDAPRRANVYRALVEACQQVRNDTCALDYTERLIALRPDDSQMMLLAASLLERKGDDASLTRAGGYITRVLDRADKTLPDERPPTESVAEWEEGQRLLRAALYYARGQIENLQHDYDTAVRDLQHSDATHPNALAAERLGEIAEMKGDTATAIEEYTRAFALPENGPAGTVDRRDLRRKLGNVWRQVHGSDEGLGDAILAAYDRYSSRPALPNDPAPRNKDAKDLSAFVLTKLDGAPLLLASLKGKVVVLSFWATWCSPCRELEPLFSRVAQDFAGNADVVFLSVNTDEDRTRVAPFIAQQKLAVPVAYSDGLDNFMKVRTLPTVMILDRTGEIAYRASGMPPQGFSESLTTAVQNSLKAAP